MHHVRAWVCCVWMVKRHHQKEQTQMDNGRIYGHDICANKNAYSEKQRSAGTKRMNEILIKNYENLKRPFGSIIRTKCFRKCLLSKFHSFTPKKQQKLARIRLDQRWRIILTSTGTTTTHVRNRFTQSTITRIKPEGHRKYKPGTSAVGLTSVCIICHSYKSVVQACHIWCDVPRVPSIYIGTPNVFVFGQLNFAFWALTPDHNSIVGTSTMTRRNPTHPRWSRSIMKEHPTNRPRPQDRRTI